MKLSIPSVLLVLSTTAFSCSHPWGGKKEVASMRPHAKMNASMMTIEHQDKMAKMHSDAARCLREGKSPDNCREMMMRSHDQMCKEMGKDGCREMGMMMGGR